MSMVASSVLLLGARVARHIKVAGAGDVNPGSGLRARRSSPAAVSVLEEPVDRVVVDRQRGSTDVSPGAGVGSARRGRQLTLVDARRTHEPRPAGNGQSMSALLGLAD